MCPPWRQESGGRGPGADTDLWSQHRASTSPATSYIVTLDMWTLSHSMKLLKSMYVISLIINLNSKVYLESTLRIFIVLYHILNKNCPFTVLHLPLDTNQPSCVNQHLPPAWPSGPGIQTPDSDLFALIFILFCTQFDWLVPDFSAC